MRPTRLLRWPAVVTNAGTTVPDEYGDPEVATTDAATVMVHAFPSSSDEDTTNAVVAMGTWTVFLPPDAEADATSTVALHGGPTLELTGPPMPWRSPRSGVVEYLTAPAKVVA